MKNNSYTYHVPFFKNSIAYDHDFWFTRVSFGSPGIFSSFFFFFNFDFLGWEGGTGVRGQKMAQNEK